jgi:hypothetical protein
MPVERYRFTIWDGDSFEYVGEWVYVSPRAAEAQAIQVAKELSEGDDTWHGGWISVENSRGYEIAKMPIGIGKTFTKYEAAARRTGRPTDCDDD